MAPNIEQTVRICFPATRNVTNRFHAHKLHEAVQKMRVKAHWKTLDEDSIQVHYLEIINFFDKRSTNAAFESFNAKIKSFHSQFRVVKDKTFFLFRLTKIYA